MNIQLEHNEHHQAVVTVDLDPTQIEQKKQQAARKLARNTHIPGFRPGKAPYPMVIRHIGEGRILEEAIEGLIDEIYPKMLDESGVKPYGPGKLESLKLEDTPPTAIFIVPLAPEVHLGDFQSVRLPYDKPELKDEDVTKAIEGMREMYAEVTVVERPAEESDLVNIILTGKLTDDEETAPFIDHESYPVIIEPEKSATDTEWPFPGFSRMLIGTTAGETKSTTYTYPEDYEDDDESPVSLKGRTATFEIEVNKVSSRQVPELNEDFIKKMGPYETVEEFEADTRKQLLERNGSSYDEEYDEHLLEELLKDTTINYPQEAIDDEVDLVFNRLKNRLENQGIGFDIYLKARNTTEEQIREELRPGAEQRLKESLLLIEIAGKENVQVSPEEIQHEVEHALGHLLSGMTEKEARRTLNDDALRGLTANIYNNTLLTKTLQHLRDMASGELEKRAAATALEEEISTEDAPEPVAEEPALATEPPAEMPETLPDETAPADSPAETTE
ncbi:MAG: trigger factor [Anaerolineales bacterium]|nr:trigger factor [Anaerolineales bacterium]